MHYNKYHVYVHELISNTGEHNKSTQTHSYTAMH